MKSFKSIVEPYERVYLQMHNNPDADAIASAFGMDKLIKSWNKESTIIYYGNRISKPNLTAMEKAFNLTLINIDDSFKVKDTDLVIIVDGQAGASNVKTFDAKNIAVIDHHIMENNYNYVYKDIQPKVGSCSTIVAKYLDEYLVPYTEDVATCLYFGILMDTDNFITKFTNFDRDYREILDAYCNKLVINRLLRSSLSLDDMRVCAEAMLKIERIDETAFTYVGECDDNLLGHLSDLISELDGVNIVVIYSDRPTGYKLSIRSYHDYISAEDVISNLSRDIGSGGGHLNKAGGFISKAKFKEKYPTVTFDSFIKIQTVELYKTLKFFIEGKDDPMVIYGKENFRKARKRKYLIRYIELKDYFEPNERVFVKTLEGTVEVPSQSKLIVGAKGEVYPITDELFEMRYKTIEDNTHECVCDGHIDVYGIVLSSETRVIKITNEDLLRKSIAETTALTDVLVRRVLGILKVRTKWGDIRLRDRGYLVYINKDNYYLCDEDIFYMTYQFTE